MASQKQIVDAFGKAAADFAGSEPVRKLLAGKSASAEVVHTSMSAVPHNDISAERSKDSLANVPSADNRSTSHDVFRIACSRRAGGRRPTI